MCLLRVIALGEKKKKKSLSILIENSTEDQVTRLFRLMN